MIMNNQRFSCQNVMVESGLIKDIRAFKNLDEESKIKVADKVSAKLVQGILKKFNKSYFSYIEASKGDITKLKDYKEIESCVSLLTKLINNNKNSKSYMKLCISRVSETINILKINKNNFVRTFSKSDVAVSKLVYDSMVAAVIEGLTGIISNFVTFSSDSYNNLILDINPNGKNISSNNFFGSMGKFIDLHTNNKLIELFNFENKKINEDAFLIVGISIAAIIALLLLARTIVYAVYYFRIKIAEKLDEVKNLLILNSSTLSKDSNNKDTLEKQKKWIDKLGEMSDKIDVDHAVSQTKANNEVESENNDFGSDDTNYDSDVLM